MRSVKVIGCLFAGIALTVCLWLFRDALRTHETLRPPPTTSSNVTFIKIDLSEPWARGTSAPEGRDAQ